ncbi:MAG: SAM-dependent methyltransferase [Prevotellaceae bacterium]|jgi:16S rRNA (cytidine1402-2'-O)-methyltransferase|nr:SAM-dependent methyltransferase [Prevotellaceae bacterium]
MPTLYLIPVTLGDSPIERVLPAENRNVILKIKHFIVEDIRSARRFLKKTDRDINIDELHFYELNQHTDPKMLSALLKPLEQNLDTGIISEAGCPAIADPGADVVRLAQERGYKVVPLVGPSSILLSLMASGFNGQNFAFNGYLPIPPAERAKALKKLEVLSENQTQIFIETPYRNLKMFDDILAHCQAQTRLCIAADITLDTEFIKTKTIKDWKKEKPLMIDKKPCIFLLGR